MVRIELAKVLHYYGLLEDTPQYKIVCPFHEDINASMKIDLDKQMFYCFGCGVSGNALKFVILANKKLDELECCFKYYKILKSKRVKGINYAQNTIKKKDDNMQALTEAADYYYGLSITDWFDQKSSEYFYLKKRGFSASVLNQCKAKININKSYPIIFPMFDNGNFKGWVCRTMDPIVAKKRKYLYNTGFSRSNTLVGNYDAKTVILVEGYMDMLKLQQYGEKNVAAILGWKITEQQIMKLKEVGVKLIISALDNDECGNKGTVYLKKHFNNVIRFQFPDGIKDPGEITKEVYYKAKLKIKGEFKWA